jgi:hypothetical protein
MTPAIEETLNTFHLLARLPSERVMKHSVEILGNGSEERLAPGITELRNNFFGSHGL